VSVFDRLFGGKARKDAARAAEWASHVAEVQRPRWDTVEALLGHPVPDVLRALYADRDLLASSQLLVLDPALGSEHDEAWWISQFTPADERALVPELESIPPGAFTFACNEFGDPYYVRLGELPDGDGPVMVHHHDGGDTELVAPSLRAFLSWCRQPES
jgi:SMI1 / KNR4 family (SUKH-1)